MNERKKSLAQKYMMILLILITGISLYNVSQNSELKNQILLPSSSFIDLNSYITISGTLIATTPNPIANPLNINEFTCEEYKAECQLVQAEIWESGFLSLYTETFPVETWNDQFIIFSTAPDSSQCVKWTYRIDRLKEELIGVREKAADYNSEFCDGVGLEAFEVKIVDGSEAMH